MTINLYKFYFSSFIFFLKKKLHLSNFLSFQPNIQDENKIFFIYSIAHRISITKTLFYFIFVLLLMKHRSVASWLGMHYGNYITSYKNWFSNFVLLFYFILFWKVVLLLMKHRPVSIFIYIHACYYPRALF